MFVRLPVIKFEWLLLIFVDLELLYAECSVHLCVHGHACAYVQEGEKQERMDGRGSDNVASGF